MLSPKELQAIEDRKPVNRQLVELQKIAEDMGRLVKMLTYTSSKTEKGMGDVGSLLMDIRESIDDLVNKEDPESPDHAKPVVEALSKLEKVLTKAVSSIDVQPQVDVSVPDIKVDAPKLDLTSINKILKNDIPKAFDKAIKGIPKTEIPKNDYTPLVKQLKELSEKLDSIDTGVRLKPTGVNAKIINSTSDPVPVDIQDSSVTVTGTITETNSAAIKTAVETIDNAISGNEMQVDVVGALPAGTNAIGKLAANSGVDIGDVDVTSAVSSSLDHGSNRDIDTTAEQITSTSFACKFGVIVKADITNTGIIYVGNSDVTAGTTAGTDGFPLSAGETLTLEVNNPNLLYAIASANNQIIYWTAV